MGYIHRTFSNSINVEPGIADCKIAFFDYEDGDTLKLSFRDSSFVWFDIQKNGDLKIIKKFDASKQ